MNKLTNTQIRQVATDLIESVLLKLEGRVMGTFQSSASLARVVGPLIAGLLYDSWQPGPFLLAAAVLVVVFAISAGLPRSVAPPRSNLEPAL